MQYNYDADTRVPKRKATVPWPSPQTLKMKHDKAKRSSSERMYVITAYMQKQTDLYFGLFSSFTNDLAF